MASYFAVCFGALQIADIIIDRFKLNPIIITYFLFGIGILTITFGYILMATGETNSFRSVKFAPVILVIGYCIIIPISIFYKFQESFY